MCSGTRGGSESSFNTVLHENVRVHMNQYVNGFLKFPQIFSKTALSSYFYKLNKNLLKFFSTPTSISSNYQTFLKLSDRQVQNFKFFVFVKFTQIHPWFTQVSSTFFQIILKFPQSFSKYSSNFSSKFQQILLKIKTFF